MMKRYVCGKCDFRTRNAQCLLEHFQEEHELVYTVEE
jgi:hypothetical protein